MSIFKNEQFTTIWGYGEYHKFDNPLNDPIHSIGKDLHGRFLPEIPYQLINKYCLSADDKVIDPFGGTGTVMVEAVKLQREVWSFDINSKMIDCQNKKYEALKSKTSAIILQQSCLNIPTEDNFFQLLITSPPYPYAIEFNPSNPQDISNNKDYETYLEEYEKYLDEFIRVVKPGGYICQVLSDVVDNSDSKDKKTVPFIADVTILMRNLGMEYVRTITFPFQREITRAQGKNGEKNNQETLGIVSDNILNKGWYIFADEKIVIFKKPSDVLPIKRFHKKESKNEKFSFEEIMMLYVIKKEKMNRKSLVSKFNNRGEVSLMLQSRKMLEKVWYDSPEKIYKEFGKTFSQERLKEDFNKIKTSLLT